METTNIVLVCILVNLSILSFVSVLLLGAIQRLSRVLRSELAHLSGTVSNVSTEVRDVSKGISSNYYLKQIAEQLQSISFKMHDILNTKKK